MLFADYIGIWLERAKISVDFITYQGYLSVANAHIIPYFKAKQLKLCDVSREKIQAYIDEKSQHGRLDGKGGLSPKTIKNAQADYTTGFKRGGQKRIDFAQPV